MDGKDVLATEEALTEEGNFLLGGRSGVDRWGGGQLLLVCRDALSGGDRRRCYRGQVVRLTKPLLESTIRGAETFDLSAETFDFLEVTFHYGSIHPEAM